MDKPLFTNNIHDHPHEIEQTRIIIFTLTQLNDKFSGEINGETVYTFHEQHFTCSMVCESCNKRCENTVDHSKDGVEHKSSNTCTFQPQFDNKMYLCKYCDAGGRKVVVRLKNHNSNETAWIGIAKFAWTGYIIDCPNCGEIFRSRQYWYGNKSPENVCVLQETIHVWKDSPKMHGTTNTHSAQVILDGISYLSDTLTSVSAQPTKSLSSWVADKIVNPAYWKPNSEIIVSVFYLFMCYLLYLCIFIDGFILELLRLQNKLF